jgi:hypothetical protein
MHPWGDILVDGMDVIQDIRTVPNIREQVREAVTECLKSG